jgi:hypothetical protein
MTRFATSDSAKTTERSSLIPFKIDIHRRKLTRLVVRSTLHWFAIRYLATQTQKFVTVQRSK